MSRRQRVVIAGAGLALVVLTAVYAVSTRPGFDVRVELPPIHLPLPQVRTVFAPGEDGVAPLLIVVENSPQARPQSGLADACLVIEMPTEGGITRFLAAFCDAEAKTVGPVRSIRKYMLDLAADFGGILVHAGYSTEAYRIVRTRKIPVINEFWTPGPFWRDPARTVPHNLYTGIDRLREALQKRPLDVKPKGVPYAFGDAPEGGAPATTLSFDFGRGYAVRYRYDAERRVYLRDLDGQPHVDADGRPIAPVSVLVMYVRWWQVLENGEPSGKIDLRGPGRLRIFTRGRSLEGTWKRPADGRLTFQDAGGRAVVLPRGPVWIELFPADRPSAAQARTSQDDPQNGSR